MNNNMKKNRKNDTKDILMALLAVSFLASGGIWVKLSHLSPINTGFYRVLFSIPIFFPFTYKGLKKTNKKDVIILFCAGIFLAGDVALWNISFSYTSVANANLLANLTPLTVIPLSYWIFKEKISKAYLLGAGVTFLGVFILLGGKINPQNSNYLGDLLSFLASFFYAGFLLISYHLRDRIKSSIIMFISGFGSVITLGISAFLVEGIQIPKTLPDIVPLLGLTLCLQVIGHNLLAHCQGNLNVNLSTIICLVQPAIATIYAFLIFKEKISFIEILGVFIVIFGVYITKMQYNRRDKSND